MKTNWQDPQTSEIRSTHISGLQDAIGKIEDVLDLKLQAETNVPLTEVYISEQDRYRIYQAPAGKRNWVSTPSPVIKKNGVVISSGFTIDYGGGAIIVSPSATSTDTFTADVSYTKTADNALDAHQADYANIKTSEVINLMHPSYSVKDDGTITTTAFQNAVNAAAGKTLLIPKPSVYYALDNEITLPSDITIVALGNYPEIKQTAASKRIFVGDSLNNIIITGLKLTGYDTANPEGNLGLINITNSNNIRICNNKVNNSRNGIVVTNSNKVWIKENEVYNFGFIGIIGSRNRNFHIDFNDIRDCTKSGANAAYGIQCTGGYYLGELQKKNTVIGNVIENIPSWDGFMSHDSQDLLIAFNKFINVRNGIDLSFAYDLEAYLKNITIIFNECYGTDTDTWSGAPATNTGIVLFGLVASQSHDGSTNFIENVTCYGNIIENFGKFNNATYGGGIGIGSIKNALIAGNKISNIGTGNLYWGGITLGQRIEDVIIKDNHIKNTNTMGISLRNVYRAINLIIKNNIITCTNGTMTAGIRVDSANVIDGDISGNKVRGITNHILKSNYLYTGVFPYCDQKFTRSSNDEHAIAPLYTRQGYAFLDFRKDIIAVGSTNTNGSTNLVVSDTTGVSINDVIHIEYLINGEPRYFSTKVNAIVDATNLTLAKALPADVPDGSPVYVVRWVSKIN